MKTFDSSLLADVTDFCFNMRALSCAQHFARKESFSATQTSHAHGMMSMRDMRQRLLLYSRLP